MHNSRLRRQKCLIFGGLGRSAGILPATTLVMIHSYCRLTLPTLRLDLIFLLQTDVGWVEKRNPTTIFLPYGRCMQRPYLLLKKDFLSKL